MKIIIYTDGGSRGNPGIAGIGVVYKNEKGETIKKYSHLLGDKLTNNEAEYGAVIFALKKFKALFGKEKAKITEIEFRCDSELLVKQLSGEYKVIDEKIQKLFFGVWNLKINFKNVSFKTISREKNMEADALANEAMDGQTRKQTLL
ncbi:MAG: ribonuclease HI family protein [Patescibacteria group bacterium]